MPPDQVAFINQINNYASQYRAAESSKNDILMNRVFNDRKKYLCSIIPEVSNWIGEVKSVQTSLGSFVHDVKPVYVRSSVGGFGFSSDNVAYTEKEKALPLSEAEVNPELYKTITRLKNGEHIRFSGVLGHHDDGCVMELSLTQHGGMTDPAFNIKHTEVKD